MSGSDWGDMLRALGVDPDALEAGETIDLHKAAQVRAQSGRRLEQSELLRIARSVQLKKALRLWIPLWEAFGDGTEYITEYRFHPQRRWRADVAFLAERVFVEFEGLGGARGHEGRHRSFLGIWYDMRKYNAAQRLGYLVYRVAVPALEKGLRDQNKELVLPQDIACEVVEILQMRRERSD